MPSTEYGREHRALRRALLARYVPGVTPCVVCNEPMSDTPDKIHLAHKYKRGDPRRAFGPRALAHADCNTATNDGSKDPQPRGMTKW